MRGAAARRRWPRARSGSAPGSTTRPARYATTEELAALTDEAGRHGGFYHTHVRYPLGDRYLDPFREAIEIGRRADAPAHITHFYHRETHPGAPEPMLALVDDARAEGLDVTFDTYPSEWASTRLLIQLPQWIQAGGPGPLKERLADRAARDRIRAEFTARGASYAGAGRLGGRPARRLPPAREPALGGPDAWPTSWPRPATTRSTSSATCCSPRTSASARSRAGRASATLPLFVAHPVGMVGTDSTFLGDKPSPRTYGSFPRILGQFVRDEALLSLEEAIRKMTSAPAARLGLRDAGSIRDGAVADLVVFDPATVRSTATYDEPRTFPIGIEHVIVAGDAGRRRRRPHRRDAGPGAAPRPATERLATPGGSGRRGRALAVGWLDVGRCRGEVGRRAVAPRRSSANIRSWASAEGVARLAVGRRGRPADGQAHRDRARFEPQLAGRADALDVVDGLDLVGLGQQDAEATGPEPGDVVGATGLPAEDVGERRAGSGRPRPGRARREPFEPVELDEHDRRRPAIAIDPGRLVDQDRFHSACRSSPVSASVRGP